MLFSSNIFLFLFLPIFVVGYHALFALGSRVGARSNRPELPTAWGNAVLFALSLFFYFWGSGKFIAVFAVVIVLNTLIAGRIAKAGGHQAWLTLGVTLNLSLLIYFKYFTFLYTQVGTVSGHFGTVLPALAPIFLPVGVSFYVFMAISYLVEVHQGRVREVSLLRFGTYLTLFPHLVAGPIVRYTEIADELRARKVTRAMIFDGVVRFSFGLGKKVLVANNLGAVADRVFGLPSNELTVALSWLGIACYTLQIYFDFSGYSDMAIGLARFFGFHFPENFNQPYRAQSVTDFWRRWHMSLSRWFKDYLYIALGGNRGGPARTYFNLFMVFVLCGLWHGASWTFMIWGLFHGALLVIERLLRLRFKFEPRGVLGQAVTLLLVMIGWVFFRAPTWSKATEFLGAMFGHTEPGWRYLDVTQFVDGAVASWFVVGVLLVFFPFERLAGPEGLERAPRLHAAGLGLASLVITFLAMLSLSKTQFNPFIYFQF